MHVARRQEVGAVVVGEEDLAGVEAGRRGKGPAAGGALVVRDLRRIVRVEGEEVEPAGVAADRGEQDHLLEVGDRGRVVPRGEGQRPVGDRGALGEAARAPAVDRLDQREVHRLGQTRRNVGEPVEHDPALRAEGFGAGLEAEAREQGAGADERRSHHPAAGSIEHCCLLGSARRPARGPAPGGLAEASEGKAEAGTVLEPRRPVARLEADVPPQAVRQVGEFIGAPRAAAVAGKRGGEVAAREVRVISREPLSVALRSS